MSTAAESTECKNLVYDYTGQAAFVCPLAATSHILDTLHCYNCSVCRDTSEVLFTSEGIMHGKGEEKEEEEEEG